MKPWALVATVAVVTVAVRLIWPKYIYGGKSTATLDRDPNHLVPSFAKRLNTLFARMRAQGYDPMLYEGYRTLSRAKQLQDQGVGKADSLHTIGLAVDIVSESQKWDAPNSFWAALGKESRALGFAYGGDFSNHDFDHVQAVAPHQEALVRALDPKARDRFVSALYAS